MTFHNPHTDVFIPDNLSGGDADLERALARTTHIAIVAHQDDIEIMAYHGIAECFGNPERGFAGVVVSDGAGSPRSGIYFGYTDERMKAVRIQEQRKAAYVGEYSCQIQLGYPSGEVKTPGNRDIRADLRLILESSRAQTVYVHNLADKHPTHIGVAMHALAALRELPPERRPVQVFGCEVWRDLDWLPDAHKRYLPVSERENLATALVGVFDSQISGGKRYDLSTHGRRLANATFSSSHSTDRERALSLAMDLTPLVQNPNLDPATYVLAFIDEFKADVLSQLGTYR